MAARDEAFRQGLRALGYVVGQNITIEYRWADGKNERLPGFAAELVNLKLDVIVTHGVVATRAAKQATNTIPIVIAAADDPLAMGLVPSLARPGGNITGLTLMTPDLTEKRLELLKAILPAQTRVAVLWNPGNPVSEPELRKAEAAARSFGLQLQPLGVRDPGEFASAFSSMKTERAGAVFVLPDAMFFGQRKDIVDLAASNRLPLVAHLREFADAGGLMTYGPNVVDLHRRAAYFVDKILKGAKPGDLPIEQPTKFELVINLKTAKALGLTIPPLLLLPREYPWLRARGKTGREKGGLALTLVRGRAGRRGIALHQEVDQRLGQIRGDERKIKQVLLNLLSNAVKFTPEGGRVDVRASVVDGMAEISVTDTGVGIAPEDQEAVFEEFRQVGTAAKQVEGTGLGPALSRKFIELHGGRIWVKSQVGMGSTFTFTLPLTI